MANPSKGGDAKLQGLKRTFRAKIAKPPKWSREYVVCSVRGGIDRFCFLQTTRVPVGESLQQEEENKMKKMFIVLPLAALLLTLTIGIAGARYSYEDPALCVAGKWLTVDAAHPAAVMVSVPEDTPYGDQKAGGCKTPLPNVPLINVVRERGEGHIMHVRVDGKGASTPTVSVSYGGTSFTKANDGKGMLNFDFRVP
jgi:hypothetical protein